MSDAECPRCLHEAHAQACEAPAEEFGQTCTCPPLMPWQQSIIDRVLAGESVVEAGMYYQGRRGGKDLVDRFVQDFQLKTGMHAHWVGPKGLLCINGSCESADDWRNRP